MSEGEKVTIDSRMVIDSGIGVEVDYYTFVTLPDLGDMIGSPSDEVLLMGIS